MHRSFRIKNLFIILFTQWVVWYVVFYRYGHAYGVQSAMTLMDVGILGIVTVLIAIGAYIINDVYDIETDTHNGKSKYSDKKKLVLSYWTVNGIGLIFSLIIAWRTSSLGLLWIYPTAVLTLYLYSRLLKGTPLFGNFIVGLFCALVPGILFLAERNMISEWKVINAISWGEAKEVVWMMVLFSFLSTMYREQVKDLEDEDGDRKAGYLTLPVVYGTQRAKALAVFSGCILLISIGLYASTHSAIRYIDMVLLGILISLITASIYKLYRSVGNLDYYYSSKLIKYAMLAGIVYLLIPLY